MMDAIVASLWTISNLILRFTFNLDNDVSMSWQMFVSNGFYRPDRWLIKSEPLAGVRLSYRN